MAIVRRHIDVQLRQRHAVHGDGAGCGDLEPAQQLDEGGLAGAVEADDAERGPGFDRQIQALEHGPAIRVREINVAEADLLCDADGARRGSRVAVGLRRRDGGDLGGFPFEIEHERDARAAVFNEVRAGLVGQHVDDAAQQVMLVAPVERPFRDVKGGVGDLLRDQQDHRGDQQGDEPPTALGLEATGANGLRQCADDLPDQGAEHRREDPAHAGQQQLHRASARKGPHHE